MAVAADAGFRGKDPPVTKPYCSYHRDLGHTTYKCLGKTRDSCVGNVHTQSTSVLTVPFQQAGQVMAHARLV